MRGCAHRYVTAAPWRGFFSIPTICNLAILVLLHQHTGSAAVFLVILDIFIAFILFKSSRIEWITIQGEVRSVVRRVKMTKTTLEVMITLQQRPPRGESPKTMCSLVVSYLFCKFLDHVC